MRREARPAASDPAPWPKTAQLESSAKSLDGGLSGTTRDASI
jgi:hypothetical protein